MPIKNRLQDHWLDIDNERLERYESMFRWNPATEIFYEAAEIGQGQRLVDFGCGPGHAAVEFARRVGASGHVHAMDINTEFIRRAKEKAAAAGLEKRITTHLLMGDLLPLPDASIDRIIARNTIIYVADPAATFREFRRVLKPGGIAHAIEGDWRLTSVEPVPTREWMAVIEAASWAWPHPEIGRRLYGVAKGAGFEAVSVQVLTKPDTEGRLIGMINTVMDYGGQSGLLDDERLDAIRETIERSLSDHTYLAIAPQFVATARR